MIYGTYLNWIVCTLSLESATVCISGSSSSLIDLINVLLQSLDVGLAEGLLILTLDYTQCTHVLNSCPAQCSTLVFGCGGKDVLSSLGYKIIYDCSE